MGEVHAINPVGAEVTWPSARRVRRVAWSIIGISVVMLVVSFGTVKQGRTIFKTNLGGDWLAFHDAAVILNSAGAQHLYDTQLQGRLYHAALPDEPGNVSLPYANAPFLAMVIKPLGKVSYAGSFAIWTACSLLMFFGAICVAWKAAGLPWEWFGIAILVCCSFEPFAFECIHGGQISSIGLLAMCGAACLHVLGWPIFAGISLAICTYKPTLLPIVLLMLVATRQWRVLAGFGYGAVILVAISMSRMGGACWIAYAKTLHTYASNTSSGANETIFRTWKFIDLNSFLKLLGASPRWIAMLLVAFVTGIYRWLSSRVRMENLNDRRLAWAIALSGTLVVNIYVGIYDSVLILPSLMLTAGATCGAMGARSKSPAFRWLCGAIYILPWCSQAIAQWVGLQPFTIAVAAAVVWQGMALNRKRQVEQPGAQNVAMQSDNSQVSNLAAPMLQL
jgi:Glycosyltransferase family 87